MNLKEIVKSAIEWAKNKVYDLINKLFEWLEKKVNGYFETHLHSWEE